MADESTKHLWKRFIAEYRAWSSMRDRCGNRSSKNWPYYGGRGIAVCERWATFANFLKDMGTRPSPKHTLDRIDNSRGYSPENCRWATRAVQSANRRNSFMVKFRGKEMCLTELSRLTGIKHGTLKARIAGMGWSVEKAAMTPPGATGHGKGKAKNRNLYEFGGRLLTITEIARENGLRPSTLIVRVKVLGWPLERAITTPARKRRKSIG